MRYSGLGNGDTYNRCNFGRLRACSRGSIPEFHQLTGGRSGYNTDWNNFAPSAQIAWRPNVQSGFMRTLLGDPEQATFRAGYSAGYERQGMAVFTGVSAPIRAAREPDPQCESRTRAPGEEWPVLLSQRDRLYNAPFPETPTYPIAVAKSRGRPGVRAGHEDRHGAHMDCRVPAVDH